MKTLIMGNSSSGKSTLAKNKVAKYGVAHLDLDVLAWLPCDPPERMPIEKSAEKIRTFINQHKSWVIEGCYADLLAFAAKEADELIFMNLSVEDCVANAKNRPWEPHKYESKAAQDANLNMLIEWITQYPLRVDVCSLNSHLNLFENFSGSKHCYIENLKVDKK
ncbi:shikimate kinase [Marinicella rhabdoformis]|uniref:shikimate kinase n=1 Tax=Marinicella rhabdoformis TaxID=2580566 RepID=UPI0012AEDFB0|nr:shikimate kinase [Marinicella rhabdoformis]